MSSRGRTRGGASISVVGSDLTGPLHADGAASLTLRERSVQGPVTIEGSTGPVVVAGNEIVGPLRCHGNAEAPSHEGVPNEVIGPAVGQCAALAE